LPALIGGVAGVLMAAISEEKAGGRNLLLRHLTKNQNKEDLNNFLRFSCLWTGPVQVLSRTSLPSGPFPSRYIFTESHLASPIVPGIYIIEMNNYEVDKGLFVKVVGAPISLLTPFASVPHTLKRSE